VSYKDNVKASERFVVKCSEDASQIFAEAHKDCMEHHEEVNVLFLNRANRVIGISCISKGGLCFFQLKSIPVLQSKSIPI
jgi:DNA repair protein RadC